MDLNSKFYKIFTTHADGTGVNTDADTLPLAVLYKNGVVNDMPLTVLDIGTGIYRVISETTFQADGDWAAGDFVECLITATVGGVVASAVIAGGDFLTLDAYLQKFLEADVKILQTVGGWEKVWYEKGTSIVLMSKLLKNLTGNALTSERTTVGQVVEALGD